MKAAQFFGSAVVWFLFCTATLLLMNSGHPLSAAAVLYSGAALIYGCGLFDWAVVLRK